MKKSTTSTTRNGSSPSTLQQDGNRHMPTVPRLGNQSLKYDNEHKLREQDEERKRRSASLLFRDNKVRGNASQRDTINGICRSVPNSTKSEPIFLSTQEHVVPAGLDQKKVLGKNAVDLKSTDSIKTQKYNNSSGGSDSNDDMDCDSAESYSFDSSSSSLSHKKESFQNQGTETPTTCSKDQPAHQVGQELEVTQRHYSPNAIPTIHADQLGSRKSIVCQSTFATEKTILEKIRDTTTSATVSSPPIEDPNVFNLLMKSKRNNEMDDELLGSTIGDGQFILNCLDDNSDISASSSLRGRIISVKSPSENQRDSRKAFKTQDVSASKNNISSIGSLSAIKKDQNNHTQADMKHKDRHQQPAEKKPQEEEEESVEAWSIQGQKTSPFFFKIDGKRYGHPTLPPGWTLRISQSLKQPVYSHPDHGCTWHCPIKLTPNMVYIKRSDGKIIKQTKSSSEVDRTETSLKDLDQENPPEHDVLKLSRTTRDALRAARTPPSTRELPSRRMESIQSALLSEERTVSHFSSPENENDSVSEESDSTFGLMQEISQLSVGLMKNSSSNLQKVREVKMLHQDIRKEQDCGTNLSQQRQEQGQEQPLQSDNEDTEVDTSSTVSIILEQSKQTNELEAGETFSIVAKLDFDRGRTPFHPKPFENETPSTMSALISQYHKNMRKYRGDRCSTNLKVSSPSKKCNLSNSEALPRKAIGTNARKKLSQNGETSSPVEELTVQSGDGPKAKKAKSGRIRPTDVYPTKNANKKNESKDNPSVGTPISNSDLNGLDPVVTSGSMGFVTTRSVEKIVSKHGTLTRRDRQSTPNPSRSQEMNSTEHIEAWFTPATPVYRASDIIEEDVATLRFGANQNSSQPRLHLPEKIRNERTPAAPDVYSNSKAQKQSSQCRTNDRRLQNYSPVNQDDEWSPLAQQHSNGNHIFPSPQHIFGQRIDKTVYRNCTPYGARIEAKESGIPLETHSKHQHSSDVKIILNRNSIENFEWQAAESISNSIATVLQHRNSNCFLKSKRQTETKSSQMNMEVENGVVPSIQLSEKNENGSLSASSTESGGRQLDKCGCPSEAYENNADEITIEKHVYAVEETISPNAIAEDQRPEFTSKQRSIPSIDSKYLNTRDKGHRDYSKDGNVVDLADSGMGLTSEESSKCNDMDSADAQQHNDTAFKKNSNKSDNSAEKSMLAMAGKTRISNNPSRDESAHLKAAEKTFECTQDNSVSVNHETSLSDSFQPLSEPDCTSSLDGTSTSDNREKPNEYSIRVLHMEKAIKSRDQAIISNNNGFAKKLSGGNDSESLNESFAVEDRFSDEILSRNGSSIFSNHGNYSESSQRSCMHDDSASEDNKSRLRPTGVENDEDPREKRAQEQFNSSPRSYTTSIASSKDNFGCSGIDDAASASGLSSESSVQPIILKNRASENEVGRIHERKTDQRKETICEETTKDKDFWSLIRETCYLFETLSGLAAMHFC
ncbi:unnamed protein product [Pseudo-nitzschia multistriata]|uniref:Uncharacterized protein n=1 Tax=Pseudo-nitzschia multistriata TaxID=183589 RepID=A0A448Z8X9_9STRA|nr:unnamed protein product [Pseudo-nitzschia multistriata]